MEYFFGLESRYEEEVHAEISPTLSEPPALEVHTLDVQSRNFIVMNLDNNQVLRYLNPDEFTPIASLTKIMTTLLAIEMADDLDEKVIITEAMLYGFIQANASMAGLRVGEVVTIRDLLFATFLASGAESSRALAIVFAGNEDAFVNQMNMRALELGLSSTTFRNTTGLDEPGKGSTAREMAILLQYAMNNPIFQEIFEARTYTLSNGRLTVESTLHSTANRLGLDISHLRGGRTGFTYGAGRALASIAYDEENSISYLLVTIGAPFPIERSYHIRDALIIYEYIFSKPYQAMH
ncbi:MAG: serine hydrolase [Defluviitaleaceae bacterium]|nr:serine hydrolase [Defluviitaleaceae bacterium]